MDNILSFLEGIHLNDSKEWFFANRRAYIEAFSTNAENAQKLAKMIGKYDTAIGYLRLADSSLAAVSVADMPATTTTSLPRGRIVATRSWRWAYSTPVVRCWSGLGRMP